MSNPGASSPADAGLVTEEPVNLDSPEAVQDEATEGEDETGEEVETDETDPAEETTDEGEGSEEGEEGGGQPAAAAEELAEIEHDGKKYKVPAALKDGYLRNADYTKKTQEVAEARKQLEARDAAARQHIREYAQLVSIEDQLKGYDEVDWNAFAAADPEGASQAWRNRELLKERRDQVKNTVQENERKSTLEKQQAIAKRLEEGHAALTKEIPGWSPELAKKIVDFGVSKFGFRPEEIASVTDPRVVKVLHTAMQNTQKAVTVKKVAAIQQQQKTAPAPVARTSAAPTTPKDPNKMTMEQFAAYRKKQLAG